MQNSKNHEEEVQLRLKFESKLNQMHTQQRETQIKYERALSELEQSRSHITNIEKELSEKMDTLL